MALATAALADAVQLGLFQVFGAGALSAPDDVLDFMAAAVGEPEDVPLAKMPAVIRTRGRRGPVAAACSASPEDTRAVDTDSLAVGPIEGSLFSHFTPGEHGLRPAPPHDACASRCSAGAEPALSARDPEPSHRQAQARDPRAGRSALPPRATGDSAAAAVAIVEWVDAHAAAADPRIGGAFDRTAASIPSRCAPLGVAYVEITHEPLGAGVGGASGGAHGRAHAARRVGRAVAPAVAAVLPGRGKRLPPVREPTVAPAHAADPLAATRQRAGLVFVPAVAGCVDTVRIPRVPNRAGGGPALGSALAGVGVDATERERHDPCPSVRKGARLAGPPAHGPERGIIVVAGERCARLARIARVARVAGITRIEDAAAAANEKHGEQSRPGRRARHRDEEAGPSHAGDLALWFVHARADPRQGDDVAHVGGSAAERHMGSVLVVVGDVLADQAEQMPLPEHDDVV